MPLHFLLIFLLPAALFSRAEKDLIHYPGEKYFANVRQLTFGGSNAEGYFRCSFIPTPLLPLFFPLFIFLSNSLSSFFLYSFLLLNSKDPIYLVERSWIHNYTTEFEIELTVQFTFLEFSTIAEIWTIVSEHTYICIPR